MTGNQLDWFHKPLVALVRQVFKHRPVLLLAESHLSIHTWPEHGFAAIDAFMCGTGATLAARAIFERALAPSRVDVRVTLRGGLPG